MDWNKKWLRLTQLSSEAFENDDRRNMASDTTNTHSTGHSLLSLLSTISNLTPDSFLVHGQPSPPDCLQVKSSDYFNH